jgi:hypothetical protein
MAVWSYATGDISMSRLEALMVALGMILLGLAAARADRPDLQPIASATTVMQPAEPAALRVPFMPPT